MAVRHLLIGASALAFAAAASAAPNTVSISSSSSASPNNNNNTCVQGAGTNSNTCTIVQAGTVNTASSTQNGNGNNSYIEQRKADGGEVTLNVATHIQNGLSNDASTTQRTDSNNSAITQTSTAIVGQVGNKATVTQLGGPTNTSTVNQYGRLQTVTVTQNGAGNSSSVGQNADGTSNGLGVGNVATVSVAGNNHRATIDQSLANSSVSQNTATITLANNPLNFTTAGQSGNTATVTQRSNSNTASVALANGGAIGPQGGTAFNQAAVTQSTGVSNTAYVSIGNPGVAARASQNSSATVTQSSSVGLNYAEVTITGGVSGGDPVADPSVGADTSGFFGGNRATVNQGGTTGRSTAVVTVAKLADFQGLGNVVNVTQNTSIGYNGTASPAQGSAATADRIQVVEPAYAQALAATGQYVATYSQGRFGTINLTQSDNPGSGTVYTDSTGKTTGVGRSRANVFQAGEQMNATINQTGDNYADITQGRLANGPNATATNQPTDRRGTVFLIQVDAGDNPVTQTGTTPVVTGFDQYGNPTSTGGNATFGPGGRQYNQFVASQYGIGNLVLGHQTARDGFINAFQGTDSTGLAAVAQGATHTTGLYANLQQGTGNTAFFPGNAGTGNPGLPGTYTPPIQQGYLANGSGLNAGVNSISPTMKLVQGGTNNATFSYQDSAKSVVNVTQLGSSPFAAIGFTDQGAPVANLVIVQQQGTTNRATAIQTSTVGRSIAGDPTSVSSGNSMADNVALTGNPNAPADDFYFAGGARSSGIVILQGGIGNKARAEQRGLGQYARIEQAGTSNEASILQEINATNATAIIRQAGSGNTYYADQTLPGQYVAVDQYGTSNSTNQVIFRGVADPKSNFAQPAGFPGF